MNKLPIFFPDATRAVVRSLDQNDIVSTNTKGILVNTFHLYRDLGEKNLIKHGGIRKFMNWNGALISDSGGFQVYSLGKSQGYKNTTNANGVIFRMDGTKTLFTPEMSIKFQFLLNTDLMVVLDDFTEPRLAKKDAYESVQRTLKWAVESKKIFDTECDRRKLTDQNRPYLCGVVQGGNYLDLRTECTQRLVEMGFDAIGYGGWPFGEEEDLFLKIAETIKKHTPEKHLLYGLGVGTPKDIVDFYRLGYTIFDCVLPTRDARHGRLYVYNAINIDDIDVTKKNFYSFYSPREKDLGSNEPVSTACDCLLCKNYSKGYLTHLFKIKDTSYFRLATIHNLRFYSLLTERLKMS